MSEPEELVCVRHVAGFVAMRARKSAISVDLSDSEDAFRRSSNSAEIDPTKPTEFNIAFHHVASVYWHVISTGPRVNVWDPETARAERVAPPDTPLKYI